MYVVVGHPNSRAIRLAWLLEELGADWRYEIAPPQSDVAKAYNPSGKVPVLVDGETRIIDSVAGMTYLADKHGALTYPAGSPERARQDSFTHFACDEMDGSLWTAAKHRFALPEAQRVPQVKDTARWEWDRACDILGQRLDGPFVMGETVTVPDLVIGQCAAWAKSAKFDWPDGPVGAYFERMLAREALSRARALGAEAMA